jgi:hypothetical protein
MTCPTYRDMRRVREEYLVLPHQKHGAATA